MDEKELLDLKEDINEARDEVNRLEGRKDHLLSQLKEDWDCTSLKQAKAKLEKLKKETKKLSQQIKAGIEKLEEKYDE